MRFSGTFLAVVGAMLVGATMANHPSPSPDGKIYPEVEGLVRDYVEVFDYAGGLRFRGFVVEKDDERSLFIFFDEEVIGHDLKPGYDPELATFNTA